MAKGKRLAYVVSVIAAGVLLAWPVRSQDGRPPIAGTHRATDLPLQDHQSVELSVRTGDSPAGEVKSTTPVFPTGEIAEPATIGTDPSAHSSAALSDDDSRVATNTSESRSTGEGRSVQRARLVPPGQFIRHRIVDGDSLPKLAAKYLGDASRYREILDNNRDVLKDANVLPLNQVIVIRLAEPETGGAVHAPPLERVLGQPASATEREQ